MHSSAMSVTNLNVGLKVACRPPNVLKIWPWFIRGKGRLHGHILTQRLELLLTLYWIALTNPFMLMNGSEYDKVEGRVPQRFRNPGKASINRGIAALAVAAAGYALGFLIPWAVSSAQTVSGARSGRFMFMPVGGIASLLLAVMAIQTGIKTKRFIGDLTPARRERLSFSMDLAKENKRAITGVALGVISIAINPLIGFVLIIVFG
jgi:hypothetical protein